MSFAASPPPALSAGSPVNSFTVRLAQEDGYLFKATFDKEQYEELYLDEPAPLGNDEAPNAARILAAAVGNCLSASLLFCLSRRGRPLQGLSADVRVDIVRNAEKRLRIGHIHAVLHAPIAADDEALLACREVFEDFCTVTQSLRAGIPVDVELLTA